MTRRAETTGHSDTTTDGTSLTAVVDRTRAARRTIVQGGRDKAYRPLPRPARRAAFNAAIAAYRRGDFFEAHELLEPAWMGSDDLAERELYQGLIKVAAAYVHAVRGNPAGVRKNLVGARARLEGAADDATIDVAALIAEIDDRVAALDADDLDTALDPPALPFAKRGAAR